MWMNTIFLTSLFFVLSLGFGLFVLALASVSVLEASRLSRLQIVTLGITIGGPSVGTFSQILSLTVPSLKVDTVIVSLISVAGFLLTRNILRPHGKDWGEIALAASASLPISFMTWWWSFGAYSHYPFGDLGADVHWLKIAREYADTGSINPFASQSYIDLRTALAGMLAGNFNLDLLQFNWVYRYFSILCILLFLYALMDAIFRDQLRKWFAFLFAAFTNTLGLLTNGSLALTSSFVFLGALIGTDATAERQERRTASILVVTGSASLSILMAFVLNNNALMLALLIATSLIINILNRVNIARDLASQAFVSFVWSMALVLAHRGAYFFVPIAIGGWLFYIGVFRIVSKSAGASIKLLWCLALTLPLICAAVLAGVLAARLGHLPAANAYTYFSYVTQFVVGKSIEPGDDIILGVGPEAAIIETGRALGPLFTIGAGLMMLWCYTTSRSTHSNQITAPSIQNRKSSLLLLLWSWILGCAICVAVLSGFPFLYRTAFFISPIYAITATQLLVMLFVDPSPPLYKRRRLVASIVAAVVTILIVGVYSYNWGSDLPYSRFQPMLRPLELTGVTLTIFATAMTFTRSPRLQILGLAAVICLGVALDRVGVSVFFKAYSYGPLPDGTMVISHYDKSDLKTAHWLRNQMHNFLVVSDPYTMGLVQAVTGAPGIYLFSNLDTVNEASAKQVKRILSGITEPTDAPRNEALAVCAALSPLLANLNQEANARIHGSGLANGILKPIRPHNELDQKKLLEKAEPRSLDDIVHQMELLSPPSSNSWSVVAILNPKTIQWLHMKDGQRLPYFPTDDALNSEDLRSLRDAPFPTLFSDNQNVVVQIECTRAVLTVKE